MKWMGEKSAKVQSTGMAGIFEGHVLTCERGSPEHSSESPRGRACLHHHRSLTLFPGQCWLVLVFTSQSCEKTIPHACAWVHAHRQWGVAQEILPIPKLRLCFFSNVIFRNINKKSGYKPYIDSTKDHRESMWSLKLLSERYPKHWFSFSRDSLTK